jgi:pimeloyl-ACP methyl ester carboxylesterase
MLVNPGGPGGSGLGLATLGSAVPNNAGGYYDWIGFDPRGVGSSQPALSCIPDYFSYNRPFYIPIEQQDLQAWLHRSQAYAQACGANGGDLLNHMTTIDSARDMDSIRVALGRAQINYYGFSYGTYLGQVYATLFPSHLRRAVFDSNVDPSRIWYQANLDQDIAFNRNIKIWFGWVAKYDSVYHLGATERAVEAQFYKVAVKLRSQPILGKIGFDEWMDTFLYAGYYQFFWVTLGNAFAGYVNANQGQRIVDLYDALNSPTDDNSYAVYDAVQCTDVQWPKDWNTWSRDNWRVFAVAPFETWGNAWFNAPCLYWPAKAHQPVTVDGSKVASVLLIDETLDAATPFTGSLHVRQLFPHSSLLALPGGTTHANSLAGDACEDNLIADYLATGALPPRKPGNGPDATCAPLPQPVPSGAGAAQTAQAAQATAGALARAGARARLAE